MPAGLRRELGLGLAEQFAELRPICTEEGFEFSRRRAMRAAGCGASS